MVQTILDFPIVPLVANLKLILDIAKLRVYEYVTENTTSNVRIKTKTAIS